MAVITVEHLTQDYGHGRGVFDVSLEVNQGECYGYLGPNGAGKTTTIRHLMGFSKPQTGSVTIQGLDAWKNSAVLQNTIGYLPGELTLPTGLTGRGFLRMMEHLRGVKNEEFTNQLIERFQLDPDIGIKQMSLGVKRKLAVVTAFMHDPDILILDEPTSGLDPVMQEEFIQFVREEKERGKTIFLSSHIFHEVDAVCDRIAIIRAGRIASEFRSDELKTGMDRIYRITFEDADSWHTFVQKSYNFTNQNESKLRCRIQMPTSETTRLTEDLSELNVADFIEIPFTLEDYFMSFYEMKEAE
ncbi:MAG: ABC transporter ATP-binding protein [Oscillospiraceae bacterium]|nr:ABC transporter ATP-binding protein [Oscillospiraceae bacterium]